jgi:hypothetical protein
MNPLRRQAEGHHTVTRKECAAREFAFVCHCLSLKKRVNYASITCVSANLARRGNYLTLFLTDPALSPRNTNTRGIT